MAQLIKKIEGLIYDNIITDVNMLSVSVIFGTDDYFKIFGFEGLIQNFSKVIDSEKYEVTNEYGLKFNKNNDFDELEISY